MPIIIRQVSYSKQALRVLTRCPRNVSQLIRAKVDQYAADPASLAHNVKALKGEDGLLRVGDWRVIFTETLEIVDVVKIAPRGDAYS